MRQESIVTVVDRADDSLICPGCGEHIWEINRTEDGEGCFIRDNCQTCGALLPDSDVHDARKERAEEFIGYCMDDVQNDLMRRKGNYLILPRDKKTRDQFPAALLGGGSLIVGMGELGVTADRYGAGWCYRGMELTRHSYVHVLLFDDAGQPCPVEIHYYMEEAPDLGRFPEQDFILNPNGRVIRWELLNKEQQERVERAVQDDARDGGYTKHWWEL